MKLIYFKRYAIFAIFAFQACGKSFLDAPPTDLLPREEVVYDLEGCERLLRGTYTNLSKSYDTYSDIYPELVADNVKPVDGAVNMLEAYTWSQIANESNLTELSPGSVNMNGYSYRYYNNIRVANFLIEKTEEYRNQNTGKADYIIGCSLTVRAYSYFMLVNVFAQPYGYTPNASHPGVVYSNSGNWTEPVSGRASVAEVYGNIISDLERAVALLQAEPNKTYSYNKHLPAAILSRVYLAKGDYASSLKHARSCMNKYPLMTIANGYPDDLYKETDPSQTEVIFSLLPKSSHSMGYSGGGVFSNNYYMRNEGQHFVATTDIIQLLTENPNDIRGKWLTQAGTDWKISKYPQDGVIEDVTPKPLSYYQCVVRVSEMYLNAAECSYHLQHEDDARNYITQIIQRADPSAPVVTATGQALLDLIRKERRKELAFEGFRLYDLQRWKLPILRTDASGGQASLVLPNNKAIAPIPVLDLQGNGMIQNPGY